MKATCDLAQDGVRYAMLNGSKMKENIMETFVYANCVTNFWFAKFLVIGFFLVTFLGSLFMQLRFRNMIKPETSLLAASFATLGFATILEMTSGILSPVYFVFLISITIIAVIWNATTVE